MIDVNKVTKYFGSFAALDGVTFHMAKGEVVGFLGQNGAGKTTLMRIITSYLPPSHGNVRVAGFDVVKDSLKVRQRIGYLPETPPLYPGMSVGDYLKFAAQLKNVPARQVRLKIDKVLEDCHIKDVEDKIIATLSKGYKQRVGIAQAIINDPAVLILDEPTNGLDPVQIRQVRQLIKGLKNERTVIVSTHILSEIQQIAERVIIIKSGKILKDKKLSDLLAQSGHDLEKTFLDLVA